MTHHVEYTACFLDVYTKLYGPCLRARRTNTRGLLAVRELGLQRSGVPGRGKTLHQCLLIALYRRTWKRGNPLPRFLKFLLILLHSSLWPRYTFGAPCPTLQRRIDRGTWGGVPYGLKHAPALRPGVRGIKRGMREGQVLGTSF
jgi:hypothetical protein